MRNIQGFFKHAQSIVSMALALFIAFLCLTHSALAGEEKIFRTGIHAQPRYFSVSPGGEYLVFDTKKPLGGMHLLDLRTGETRNVPTERERLWDMGNLSRDGKRMVAVSTGMKNGKYNLDDMKIIIVDLRDWSWQEISRAGDGVKITPFFSPDGKRIYYFKGEARTEGATPAAKYDLYAIDLAMKKEEKLTDSRFYQATAGDVSADNGTVFFGKIGGTALEGAANNFRADSSNSEIVALDTHTKQFRSTSYFDSARFVDIYDPKLDGIGHMYFAGITRAEKGRYIFSLFRYDENMKRAQHLTDFSNWSRFDIAKRSGDIYISDTRDGEIVFRCLSVNANQ